MNHTPLQSTESSPTRRLALVFLALGLVVPGAAAAQDLGPSAAVPAEAPPVNPVRPTFPDDAYVLEPGTLQLESGYSVAFSEDPIPTLHVWDLYTALGVADLVEVRLAWDVLNAAAGDAGIGDLTLGLKGGFLGGFDERTALAGLFALELPTAADPFGLGEGVRFVGGLVATTVAGPVQLDFQATADLHLFLDDPTFLIPLAAAATWAPIDPLRVYADAVVALDLENFSDTQTSLLGGVGYRLLRTLEINAGARLGLSTTVPDVVLQAGVAWQVGDFW